MLALAYPYIDNCIPLPEDASRANYNVVDLRHKIGLLFFESLHRTSTCCGFDPKVQHLSLITTSLYQRVPVQRIAHSLVGEGFSWFKSRST